MPYRFGSGQPTGVAMVCQDTSWISFAPHHLQVGPSGAKFHPLNHFKEDNAMAAKKKTGKEIYFLVCKETKMQNYTVVLNKTQKSKVFKKYCPKLQRHTEHTPKKV